jgi:tetratricopeptide (TPR) repeat protein
VLAFVREIENLDDRQEFPNAAEMKEFVDVDAGRIDVVPQGALHDLKKELAKRLAVDKAMGSEPARLIRTVNDKGEPCIDITTEHLAAMCDEIYGKLKAIIDRQMNEYWTTEGSEIPIARQLELECGEHQRFGHERAPAGSFVGRERHLAAIRDYILKESHGPLVIHGASGCGKTALLARAAQEVVPERKPVVRFIGVTPNSSDVSALLSSLCQELRQRYPLEQPLPVEYRELSQELLQHFNAATAEEPLILFLDALDQLGDADDGRSLHWLPTELLPPYVKLIVSCLSDRAPDDPAGRPYAALKEGGLAAENFIDLDALSEGEAGELLFERWLPQAKRKLNTEQAEGVRKRLTTDSCRAPLYLKILFEEVRLWSSNRPVSELGENVPALLGDLLKRLGEPGHHGMTAERALGYIASARRGLSEMEILEVLYQDGDYKEFLEKIAEKTGHKLPDNPPRIPIAIWSRLRFDLAPYLAEHAAPGANVINFYHRQVAEIVRAKFLDSDNKRRAFHLALGGYFESKGLTPRKVDELPWQLAEGSGWQRLYDLLCDGSFFKGLWQQNQFDARSYWARIEGSSPLRMVEAYRMPISHPDKETDKDYLWILGILLGNTGHPEEALGLRSELVEHFRATGNLDSLSASLGNQALILMARGDLDGAMALHKEEERICRQLGNLDGLQASLGNQALILYSRGDLDGAMALHKEEERICRQLGNLDSLSASLGNQANILDSGGDLDGAMALHKEEERICRQLGNMDGLQACLGNQAGILKARGDLDGAMALHKEQERICRQLGNVNGLAISLVNQSVILANSGQAHEGLSKAEEAYQLASTHGYAALAAQIEPILNAIRQAAQGS